MKKTYTLVFLAVLMAASLSAQTNNTFIFVDNNGNEVKDGATLTINTVTQDDFFDDVVFINSDLFVKNTADEACGVRLRYTIESMENGILEVCFPSNCYQQRNTGTYVSTEGTMSALATQSLSTEWYPAAFGQCTATFQLEVMEATGFPPKYTSAGMGPKVTVNFVYPDPASVGAVDLSARPTVVKRYSANGQQLSAPRRGLTIVRMSDGTTRKEISR